MGDYKFKFIEPEKIKQKISISLLSAVNELSECLKSEGVDLPLYDIMKSYDLFLRCIGLNNLTVANDDDKIVGICSTIGQCKLTEDMERFKKSEETFQKIFTLTNNLLDEHHKITKIDDVVNNILTLFKEFVFFTNDVIRFIADLREKYNGIADLREEHKDSDNQIFIGFIGYSDTPELIASEFEIMFMPQHVDDWGGLDLITIVSNCISDNLPDHETVVVDTLPVDVQNRIKASIKEREETNKDETQDGSESEQSSGECGNQSEV